MIGAYFYSTLLFYVFNNFFLIIYLSEFPAHASLIRLGLIIAINSVCALAMVSAGSLLLTVSSWFIAYCIGVVATMMAHLVFWHWWLQGLSRTTWRMIIVLIFIAGMCGYGLYHMMSAYSRALFFS